MTSGRDKCEIRGSNSEQSVVLAAEEAAYAALEVGQCWPECVQKVKTRYYPEISLAICKIYAYASPNYAYQAFLADPRECTTPCLHSSPRFVANLLQTVSLEIAFSVCAVCALVLHVVVHTYRFYTTFTRTVRAIDTL